MRRIKTEDVPAERHINRLRDRVRRLTAGDGEPGPATLIEKWATSKQVYRIHDNIWDMASVDGGCEIPTDVFRRIPYECVFIQHKHTVSKTTSYLSGDYEYREDIEGYFCYTAANETEDALLVCSVGRQSNIKDGRCFSSEPFERVARVVPLQDAWTVDDVIGAALVRGSRAALEDIRNHPTLDLERQKTLYDLTNAVIYDPETLKGALGSLLYVISKSADIETVYVPQKNKARRGKLSNCTVHDVGYRIAGDLGKARRAYESQQREGEGATSAGRHMPTHVRRAHWHGYWTGPKDDPTGLEIKWIPPIVVNAQRGEVPGTIWDVAKTVESPRSVSDGEEGASLPIDDSLDARCENAVQCASDAYIEALNPEIDRPDKIGSSRSNT